MLRELIRSEQVKNAIIFCNRKRDVAILLKSLLKHGFNAGALHGDMDQMSRMATLDAFREGRITLLAASDVAARGLDIPDVSHIFNFDVPWQSDDYVHRIGRTGRAGKEGRSLTLVTPDDVKQLKDIEKMLGAAVTWIGDPPSAEDMASGKRRPRPRRTRGDGRAAGGREARGGRGRGGSASLRAQRRARSAAPNGQQRSSAAAARARHSGDRRARARAPAPGAWRRPAAQARGAGSSLGRGYGSGGDVPAGSRRAPPTATGRQSRTTGTPRGQAGGQPRQARRSASPGSRVRHGRQPRPRRSQARSRRPRRSRAGIPEEDDAPGAIARAAVIPESGVSLGLSRGSADIRDPATRHSSVSC